MFPCGAVPKPIVRLVRNVPGSAAIQGLVLKPRTVREKVVIAAFSLLLVKRAISPMPPCLVEVSGLFIAVCPTSISVLPCDAKVHSVSSTLWGVVRR